ncbi:Uncharacterized protein Fot_05774 [Forsythia ovata]|uniref:Uncharacterized protein n=1 Tax=Forsythia ovata TaxID=205694 RepID=A0ABD1WV31_9LAMI
MDTPTRIMTRSAAKKDSPDREEASISFQAKGLISEKNQNPHDEAGHRRMGACSSKGKDKMGKSDKPIVDKVAQSVSSSKIKKPQVYEAQDERTCHEEKLYKIMSDIRLRQDQIISQQNDLKREVRAIQGYVDDKISSFLEELKAKFDGEMRTEANPGQMVIYKSLKTGASSGLGDQQNFSDLLDDKFYTEDVMEQVEEIIKSAEKSKNSDTIEQMGLMIRNGMNFNCNTGTIIFVT